MNLGNPNAIAFSTSENHPELPSKEDSRKAKTMIGELLKPSLADLLHTVEMAGQTKFRQTKEASPSKVSTKPTSPAPKDGNSPLGTQHLS